MEALQNTMTARRRSSWWLGWWWLPMAAFAAGIVFLGHTFGFGHPGQEVLLGIFGVLLVWNLVSAWRIEFRVRCPYCLTAIPASAIACRRCGHDLG